MTKKQAQEKVQTQRRVRTDAARKARIKIIGILVGAVALILMIGLIVVVLTWSTDSSKEEKPAKTEQVVGERVERTVSGKTIEEDQKAAVKSVTEVFELALISPTKASDADRLEALDKGDFSVLDEKFIESLHFPEAATEEQKINSYQSVIVIATTIKNTNTKKEITPYAIDSWQMTQADPLVGIVYVPMNVFMGKGSFFTFEMVFIDDEWKLAPYTLVDSVRLSAVLQEQLGSMPTPSGGN